VAQLWVSEPTVTKINGLHQLSFDEVRDAVECVAGLEFVWDVDGERGERAIVSSRLRGRPALVVLYDAEHPLGDVYWLGSVYFVDR
jgi:hypothetical protein